MSVNEIKIADNLYIYSSSRYHNINSSAFLTREGVLIIDTMLFPDDMKRVRRLVKLREPKGIKDIINTHYHLDHTCGNAIFNDARIIALDLCRDMMKRHGKEILEEFAKVEPEIEGTEINLPNITFNKKANLFFKDEEFELISTPGHSPDSICVYWKNKEILFAGDTVIPVPYFYYGNREKLIKTLVDIIALKPKLIIQGHGMPIQEENIEKELNSKIKYLKKINEIVKESIETKLSKREIYRISIDKCGIEKDPDPDDSFWIRDIHISNLARVYRDLK
ncbi:MAG: MBL fold metallo-hydrolase [Actinobacteria bacterium]|nr:MBL fold metallo-hydrolase [Actinomycetota bacterium]